MTEFKRSVCSESLWYKLCSFGPPLTDCSSFSIKWLFGHFSQMLCEVQTPIATTNLKVQ